MKETVNIYNYFHNGDIFYSRMLVQALSTKFKVKFFHNLNSPLFVDIDGLEEIVGIPHEFEEKLKFDAQNYRINSWLGQDNFKYLNRINNGCTYENHLSLAKDVCDCYGIKIEDDEEFLPEIYHMNIPNIEIIEKSIHDLKNLFRKIVLICNGDVHSGQAINFDFSEPINRLSNEHPDILFLITSRMNLVKNNVININTITNVFPDLLQIGYISKKCDIIVGRASGPYCFAQNKENLLNPNKTFISFCNNINEGRFYQKLKSKFIWSMGHNSDEVYNKIKSELN